jgi:hypothetical protein
MLLLLAILAIWVSLLHRESAGKAPLYGLPVKCPERLSIICLFLPHNGMETVR